MTFNFMSPGYYLWFLPVTLILTLILSRGQRIRQVGILSAVSYLFFILASGWHVLLLLTSTIVDWTSGNRIHRSEDKALRKRWLIASLSINLGLLAVFKYLDLRN